VRVTSAFPDGVTIEVAAVSANGAPLPGVTESGTGMMRCAPSDVGATNIGGRGACAVRVGAGAGLGTVVVGVGRQAASAHESAIPP
jgi:hypothetical protein